MQGPSTWHIQFPYQAGTQTGDFHCPCLSLQPLQCPPNHVGRWLASAPLLSLHLYSLGTPLTLVQDPTLPLLVNAFGPFLPVTFPTLCGFL